jgi:hypothetical protein
MADALRILVTGFEPFGGSPVNPSAMAAESLAHGRFPGTEVRALVLPVVGGTEPGSARAALDAMLEAFPADAAIHFGEAHVRGEVSVERVAVNLRDYRIADNSGAFAEDSPVVDGAPDAITPGENGWLVPVGDMSAMSAHLDALAADPATVVVGRSERNHEAGPDRHRSRRHLDPAAAGRRVRPAGSGQQGPLAVGEAETSPSEPKGQNSQSFHCRSSSSA